MNYEVQSVAPKRNVPIYLGLFVLTVALLFFAGCTTPSDSEYESEIIKAEAEAETSSVFGFVVQEWRFFCIIFLMISIGLIALSYPVATALNIPELRAWADVELGEAFSTVLIVVLVLSILVFAEITTHAFLFESGEFSEVCTDSKDFCPAVVAKEYINSYLTKTEGIYEDLQENAINAGKLATFTVGAGAQHWIALYYTISWKPMGEEMLTVNMIMQELQFLMTLRDALIFQDFLINNVTLTLAPIALMLGIIFRSFFVTRKLGGQLMAFGIAFILVFPASYAIAMYTVQATVYGSAGSGAMPGGEFCTYSCMKLPPAAYDKSTGEGYTWTETAKLLPQESGETDEEYDLRVSQFLSGEICESNPETVCEPNPETEIDTGTSTIVSCGQYNEICPQVCRTIPYPNLDPTCSSPRTEFMCREHVPEECFEIKFVNRSDPRLSGLKPHDFEGCPEQCRPVIGLKKEGCDVGYGFVLTEDLEVNPDEVDDVMADEGYTGPSFTDKLADVCHTRLFWMTGILQYPSISVCKNFWVPIIYNNYNTSEILVDYLDYEDVKVGNTIEWDRGCPNECRWITKDGKVGFGCSQYEPMAMDDTPSGIWDEAFAATSLSGQVAAAEKTCVMIIPDKVFEKPSDCSGCNYVLDRGFTSLPPVHIDCPRLCGMPQSSIVKSDQDSMSSTVGGFAGPAEMKSISAIIVPSLILPLLSLVITFIFMRTLSPIIGGGIDISGMMRFFK